MSSVEYTICMKQRIVKIAQIPDEKCPFIEWISSLDKVTKSRVQSRLTRLLENNFGDHNKIDNEMYYHKKLKLDNEVAKVVLDKVVPMLDEVNEWNEDNLHAVILKAAEELEKKSGAVYTVLRIAISACTVTPGGCTELADILGKEESMRRLKQALAWLNE